MNAIAPSALFNQMPFAPEEAVFALGGDTPGHIWVRTCPFPTCDCRIALVLASDEGQEVLLERASSVRAVRHEGGSYAEKAAALTDLVAFELDIDAIVPYAANATTPLDLASHPKIAGVTARINGDVLDAIGRLWFHGKGLPDPQQQLLAEGNRRHVRGWQLGQMLGWDDAALGVRQDVYGYKKSFYRAVDRYCPIAICNCGEVVVEFSTAKEGASPLGYVLVKLDGGLSFESKVNSKHLLSELWSMYTARHPNYLERLFGREKTIKSLGVDGSITPAHSTKVGRNDPCRCGSGKKYKKCCGANAG